MPVNIHGKEYKTVAERVDEFRKNSKYDDYGILTDIISAADLVQVKATITNSEGRVVGSGYAEEVRGSTNINKTSALENCETSAIGRALASIGLGGTQYATANEVTDAVVNQAVIESTERLVKHNRCVADNLTSIMAVKEALANDDYDSAAEAMRELSDDERQSLNIAPTKGGIFTIQENKKFRSDEYSQAVKRYFEDK